MLVSTKADIVTVDPQSLQVSNELIEAFCKQHKLPYWMTSAKSNQGIRESFDFLLQTIQVAGDRNPGNRPLEGQGTTLTRDHFNSKQESQKSNCCS